MTDIKRVKISHVIESQIPEFLNAESPLFKDFLSQYYESQEHQSGMTDLANNLADYRQIGAFNNESLICLLYTSPSPRDLSTSRMPSSA